MRTKACFHFIHIVRTKNFHQGHFHYSGLYALIKSKDTIKVKMQIINVSNCTLYIVKFSLDLIPYFWPIFVDFQNETGVYALMT